MSLINGKGLSFSIQYDCRSVGTCPPNVFGKCQSATWFSAPAQNSSTTYRPTIMVSLRLLFALFALSVGHEEDTRFVEVNNTKVESREAPGSEMDRSNQESVVNQAQEETSSAWNAITKNGVIRNTVKQTDAWKMAQNNTFLKTIAGEMAHVYTELTNSTSANMTISDGEHPQIYAWNMGAVVVAALLVLLPVGCCGLCAWAHCDQQTFQILKQSAGYGSLLLGKVSGDADPFIQVLRPEALLMLACPALALMAAPWTTCAEGCPTWIYVLYLPILLRSKWVEYQVMLNNEKVYFFGGYGLRNGWGNFNFKHIFCTANQGFGDVFSR